ncbi:hypothetical protein M2321_003275 [Rhodoblastus acidophilus]|nr:hypothetical protein [Rhodoblastus acidophilus]
MLDLFIISARSTTRCAASIMLMAGLFDRLVRPKNLPPGAMRTEAPIE